MLSKLKYCDAIRPPLPWLLASLQGKLYPSKETGTWSKSHSLSFWRVRGQGFFPLASQNIRVSNALTKTHVPMGSWARKRVGGQGDPNADTRREYTPARQFPCFPPRTRCTEAVCMNASVMPIINAPSHSQPDTGLVHLPWIQSAPSTRVGLLSNFMSWLHLGSFSGVALQPHPITDNL